jgi:hypothetical protein
MKIPAHEAIVPRDKLTHYLLIRRVEDDKSRYLERAGFTRDNPGDLEEALYKLLVDNEAVKEQGNIYGQYYRVEGELVGTNDVALPVVTIWIVKAADEAQKYHFVTLFPGKGR